jgi:hypothetical protein
MPMEKRSDCRRKVAKGFSVLETFFVDRNLRKTMVNSLTVRRTLR